MADSDNKDDGKKEDGEGKHAKPKNPAETNGQVPPGTPIDPSPPKDDGKHEK